MPGSACRCTPTRTSRSLEWRGFALDGAADGHLGLGFDVALGAVDRRAWTAEAIRALRGATAADEGDLLPGAAEFFRVERWDGPRSLDAGFAVVVVVGGSGALVAGGTRLDVARGTTVVLPAAAGEVLLEGPELRVVVCRPPAP